MKSKPKFKLQFKRDTKPSPKPKPEAKSKPEAKAKPASKPKFKLSLKPSVSVMVGVLGVVTLAVVVLSHAVLYLVSRQSASAAVEQSATLAAENTARNVGNLIGLLEQSLDGQAGDAKLAATLRQADPALLQVEEERLTHATPDAWLVRLLPENIEVPDETRVPRMGFSDLNMVKDALAETPQPGFHQANSPDAHLAMARRLAAGGGVLLASWPAKIFDAALAEGGACGIELRQENIALAYRGAPDCKSREPDGEKPVNGTPWKIVYWVQPEVKANTLWFAGSLGASVAVVLACAALLVYLLGAGLRKDRKNLIALVTDLQSGNFLGDYPYKLAESATLAEAFTKIKRAPRELAPDPLSIPPALQPVLNISETSQDDTIARFGPVEDDEPLPHMAGEDGQAPATGIFRGCDIRGVVGDTLTADIVYGIGLAIGSEMEARGEKRIAIARDGRLSSPELFKSLAQGLLDSGRMVINLDRVPTPLLYYATHTLDARSGAMLTASSNPPEYNGLKIVIGGQALAEAGIQALGQRIEHSRFVSGTGSMENHNLIPDYIERVVSDTQLGNNLKVVVDCGNGVAALVAPALIRALGCEVVDLFCEVNGRFPNHAPDPSQPANLQALIDKVLETNADLGVAFDGDGDRLGLVDSKGKIIWPDRLMMLFAADVLSREPGADILYDACCTRHLPSQIVKNGGRPLLWKSGHSNIKAKIKESGAMLAGEMNGHIYFQERWYGFDDGIYACARIIEILSNLDESSAAAFAKLPDSVNTPELSIFLEEGENEQILEQFRAAANFSDARVTDIDGVRVDFLDGWGLVRTHATLPILMFRFEADSEKSLLHIQQQFTAVLYQIKPDIELPF